VFAVIIGTGCGGGLAIDGKLVEGANGVAGEWGHMPLPWPKPEESPGPACWCGRHGCLETWISGTGFRRDHAERTRPGPDRRGDHRRRPGRRRRGHRPAFDRYLDRLGRGLAVIADIVDPDAFVFGGGMSNVDELYERLPAFIEPHVFSDGWRARLAPAKWGDSSGVRGAARLWTPAEAASPCRRLTAAPSSWPPCWPSGRRVRPSPPTAPTVAVTGGAIQGEARGAGAVFRGVPFAAPPVGDRRWKPPGPVAALDRGPRRDRLGRAVPANGPTAGTPRTPPTAARTASISTSARPR
jgi:hypothetical protein